MEKLLREKQIYKNKGLQDFILNLEEKYNVKDLSYKYNSSVNFSQNTDVPFHKWFRYREGFSGKLIKELINDSGASKKDVIVDPFSGSGTTPVVAVLEGYHGLGMDINPLSAFVANVKMKNYRQEEIELSRKYLVNLPVSFPSKDRYSDIKKYFNEDHFESLVALKESIDKIENDSVKAIMMTAFLCIIEACSNRRRDGNGLKTVETKVKDVKKLYIDKATEIIDDLETTAINIAGEGLCIADSATNLYDTYLQQVESKNKKVGAIIFSPPYPNSFDYFESYKLELVFGDFAPNIRGINTFRQKAVRSFISVKEQKNSDKFIDLIAEEIESAIPIKEAETGKKDVRTRKVPNMIKGYFTDMQEIIRQCGLCLEKGKKTYIVVDQSAYVGVIVPTDLLLAYLAEQVGFKAVNIVECRKCRTSTQQLKRFPYLKNNIRESIVELVKE